MKKIKAIVCLVIFCSLFHTGYAQEIKKTLKTESDGYSWYLISDYSFCGVQDLDGKDIIPLSKKLGFICYEDGLFVAPTFEGDKVNNSYYSKDGKELIAVGRYDEAFYHKGDNGGPPYFWVKKGGKEGACDMNGKEVVPTIYLGLLYGIDGFKAKKNENDKWTPLNIKLSGHDDMAFVKKKLMSECNGFVWIELNADYKRYGAMDKDNNVIIPLSRNYESLKFKPAGNGKGVFEVERSGHVGLCDSDGREFLSPDKGYSYWSYEGGNFLRVDKKDEKYGVYDIDNGEIIRPGKYSYVSYNNEGFFEVTNGEYEGICNIQGKEIIPSTLFTSVSHINFADKPHWFVVEKDGKEGAYDETGRLLVHPQYADLYYDKEEGFYYKDAQGNDVALNVKVQTRSSIEELFNQAYNTPDEDAQTKFDLYMQVVQADEGNAYGYRALAYNNIGALYEDLDDLANARTYYEKSLAVSPSYELASNNLKRVKSAQRNEKLNNVANALGQIGAAIGSMNSGNSSVYGQYQNGGNTYNSNNGGSSVRTKVAKPCRNCSGTGICPKCRGNGRYYNTANKGDEGYRWCPNCNPNNMGKNKGSCAICHGTGTR